MQSLYIDSFMDDPYRKMATRKNRGQSQMFGERFICIVHWDCFLIR